MRQGLRTAMALLLLGALVSIFPSLIGHEHAGHQRSPESCAKCSLSHGSAVPGEPAAILRPAGEARALRGSPRGDAPPSRSPRVLGSRAPPAHPPVR